MVSEKQGQQRCGVAQQGIGGEKHRLQCGCRSTDECTQRAACGSNNRAHGRGRAVNENRRGSTSEHTSLVLASTKTIQTWCTHIHPTVQYTAAGSLTTPASHHLSTHHPRPPASALGRIVAQRSRSAPAVAAPSPCTRPLPDQLCTRRTQRRRKGRRRWPTPSMNHWPTPPWPTPPVRGRTMGGGRRGLRLHVLDIFCEGAAALEDDGARVVRAQLDPLLPAQAQQIVTERPTRQRHRLDAHRGGHQRCGGGGGGRGGH